VRIAIYWFRNDLRLSDNPSLSQACLNADRLLPVYFHQPEGELNVYGIERVGGHRKQFLRQSLDDLRGQLQDLGSNLYEFNGMPNEVLPRLSASLGANTIYCEQIEAPDELEQVALLREAGLDVRQLWQSSMLDPQYLPFEVQEMPDIFTQFRKVVEGAEFKFANPLVTLKALPPLPSIKDFSELVTEVVLAHGQIQLDYSGGESHARAHLDQYLERRLPDTYKETRNQLIGLDYSSKFSPWLALGCISARVLAAELAAYEKRYGANDGTYWLWFELLWRDYFRFLHRKFGSRLYRARGLSDLAVMPFNSVKFDQWRSGNTGESLIDAGMRELSMSGYLSNRMRQIVASYWIYDLQGDWRAGAAWFEARLIDYDVYSNQGNWLYIAGRGTDPRGGRPFNVAKQTQDHDPQAIYRRQWLERSG
jgi:deoxyribodipyrimidine photo-lyase